MFWFKCTRQQLYGTPIREILARAWMVILIGPKPVFITYSFHLHHALWHKEATAGSSSHWRPINNYKADARAALTKWGAACGIKFLEAKGITGTFNSRGLQPERYDPAFGYFLDLGRAQGPVGLCQRLLRNPLETLSTSTTG